jgi:putative ABC transport system substrate-binding protein
MNRRELIAILGGSAIACPLSAKAQQVGRMRRIGMLMGLPDDKEGESWTVAFQQGLQTLGWMEGRNILIEVRWAAGDANRFRAYAAELVVLAPDVMLASSAAAAAALKQETRSVPVVFVQVPDPIGLGLVASLARPSGNLTGFTSIEPTMGAKLVEVIKEIAPNIERVAVVFNPLTASYVDIMHSVEKAAQSFAVEIIPAPVHSAVEIEGTISAQGANRAAALSFCQMRSPQPIVS